MNWLTRVFLVVLRLVIGWHFLYEGLEKLQSDSWSSKGYLHEASGPLALRLRHLAGDPDVIKTETGYEQIDPSAALVERFTLVPPIAPGADLVKLSWGEHLPRAMNDDWNAYFDRFVKHYKLDDAERGIFAAELARQKDLTARWMYDGTKKVKLTAGTNTVEVERTTPQRVQDYLDKVQQVRDYQAQDLSSFGPRLSPRQKDLQTEANTMKAALLADLADQTTRMKKALLAKLSWEQKHMAAVPDEAPAPAREWGEKVRWLDRTPLQLADLVVSWGLTLVGIGLLLGLFTRLSCLAGACFLALFYLSMPPLPNLPANPLAEGHYLYINKNLIEMIALLALATTCSGLWAGLDALLRFAYPWNWKALRSPAGRAGRYVAVPAGTVARVGPAQPQEIARPIPLHTPPRRDTSHGA